MELGKLEEVNIRDVWKHEQYGFSAWLAREENIQELGDVLGLSLTNIETEKFVGNFRCDILCKDDRTDKVVLIENQLEPSNHDHLGKIITYASGLNASVIVWIVKEANEQHASAIEWLNNHTDDTVDFFLIEVHAFKIGNSVPAPQFRVIEQPNNFAKTTRQIAKSSDENGRFAKRLDFWNKFNEVLEERHKPFPLRKPSTNAWYNVAIGSSECHLSIDLVNRENKIRVGLWIKSNKDIFDSLFSKKDEIENQLSFNLEWDRKDDNNGSSINTYIEGLDFDNNSNYKDLMNKSIDIVLELKKVLKKYL